MKGIIISGVCLGLLTFFLPAPAQTPTELREEGVIYLEGNVPDKVTATLTAAVTIYSHRDFRTVLASVPATQKIELLGKAAEGYLIKANFRNNNYTGWIHPADLPAGTDVTIFDQAQKNQDHHQAIEDAIAKKTVIEGMTFDDVTRVMGKPELVTTQTAITRVVTTTWVFSVYPQPGPGVKSKSPIGKRYIAFEDGIVANVSEILSNP